MSNTSLAAFGSIPVSEAALPSTEKAAKKPQGKFLPRVQFVSTGSSKLVTDKKVEVGHWALVDGDETTDLGESIDVIVLARVDKGVDFSGDETVVAFKSSNEEDNAEYARIEAEVIADGYDSGCMYGPVYLLFLCDTEQFVELFFNNTSGRNEADNIDLFLPISVEAAQANDCEPRAPRLATLGTKEVTSKRGKKSYTYCVPTTNEGPKALQIDNPPQPAEVIERCNKFVDQTKIEKESRNR
jgi:hypothetical protein